MERFLMPGEEISVYPETGPCDAAHGYVEGGFYENGQVVDSFWRRNLSGIDHSL